MKQQLVHKSQFATKQKKTKACGIVRSVSAPLIPDNEKLMCSLNKALQSDNYGLRSVGGDAKSLTDGRQHEELLETQSLCSTVYASEPATSMCSMSSKSAVSSRSTVSSSSSGGSYSLCPQKPPRTFAYDVVDESGVQQHITSLAGSTFVPRRVDEKEVGMLQKKSSRSKHNSCSSDESKSGSALCGMCCSSQNRRGCVHTIQSTMKSGKRSLLDKLSLNSKVERPYEVTKQHQQLLFKAVQKRKMNLANEEKSQVKD